METGKQWGQLHEGIILFLYMPPMYWVQSASEIQVKSLCIDMTVFLYVSTVHVVLPVSISMKPS